MTHHQKASWMNKWGIQHDVRAIVTYKRADGAMFKVLEGVGDSVKDAVTDADRQLRPGTWTRISISTPSSILIDVVGDRVPSKSGNGSPMQQFGEGKTVVSPEPYELDALPSAREKVS